MSETAHRLKEQLAEELADLMLDALKEKAGVYLTRDQYYKRKEELMNITRFWVLS